MEEERDRKGMIKLCFVGLISQLIVGPAILTPIFYYGTEGSDEKCSDDRLLHLSDWLFGYGIAAVCMMGFININGILAIIFTSGSDGSSLKTALVPSVVIMGLFGAYMTAWCVIGGIVLFRDSTDCEDEAYPMWAFSIFLWVFMLIFSSGIMIGGCAVVKSRR